MSGARLRLLLVEDSPDDAELLLRALRRGGYEPEALRVESQAEMEQALRRRSFDAVISDHNLPGFSAMGALEVLRVSGQDLPFLVVSGAVGEEKAAELMRAGAHDFLVKGNFARLAAAVEREIREASHREHRRRAEQAKQLLLEAGSLLVATLDSDTTFRALARLLAPGLADSCLIHRIDKGGSLLLVASVHSAPGREAKLVGLNEALRAGARGRHPLREAIRGGRPRLYEDLTGAALDHLSDDPAVRRQVRELGLRSALILPLIARGRTLGVITLLTAESGRRLDAEDATVGEEIARRAALALDNSRLFQEAQEAVRLRDEFIVIASHELKTPITPLRLQIQSLVRLEEKPGLARLPDGRAALMLHSADRSVRRLSRLVDEILDASRLEGPGISLEREELDLASLASGSVQRFCSELEMHRCPVQLLAEGPVLGRWDRALLEKVMDVLLANAIRYGRDRPIEIVVRESGEEAHLSVRDHGIGIAAEEQKRIFGRFERAVPARNFGGLGLGLFIANRIVEAHGGKIQVHSMPGEGAEFEVMLPLGLARESAKKAG